MNKQWQDFIQSQTSSDKQSDTGAYLIDLSHLGLIRCSGEECSKFLQGQLTNDVTRVDEGHSQLTAWCSAKGRMLASFRLFKSADAHYLQTQRNQIENLLKRLRMYVFRAKVEISDASDETVCFGLLGAAATDLLSSLVEQIPEAPNESISINQLTLIRMPGDLPRYQIIGPAPDLIELWTKLSEQSEPGTVDQWALADIHAGTPTVYSQTVEAFVPQMTNMQLIDGVSFKKGCYTGQEVVARMQYLGKLKRRMYLAHVETDVPPAPGDELFALESQSPQGAGRIVDARPAGNGFDCLAVIEIASAENGDVHLGVDGPKLNIGSLPYSFKQDDSPSQ